MVLASGFSWFWVSETTYPYVLLEDFSWSFIQKENNQIFWLMILLLKNGICWTNSFQKQATLLKKEWKKLRIRS